MSEDSFRSLNEKWAKEYPHHPRLSDEAIGCILTSVGEEYVPPDFDRGELKGALQIVYAYGNLLAKGKEKFPDSTPNEYAQKLERALKAIRRLREMLNDQDVGEILSAAEIYSAPHLRVVHEDPVQQH